MDHWAAVIMAAGEGSRMQSNVPKVLHTVCGKDMILYSLDKLSDLGIDRVMVVVSELNYYGHWYFPTQIMMSRLLC